jgi:hypothetical protein
MNTHNTIIFASFLGEKSVDPEGTYSSIDNSSDYPFFNYIPATLSMQISARELIGGYTLDFSTNGITGLGQTLTAFNIPDYIYNNQNFYFTAKLTDGKNNPIKNVDKIQAEQNLLILHNNEGEENTVATIGDFNNILVSEGTLSINLLLSDDTVVKSPSAIFRTNFGQLSANDAGGYLKAIFIPNLVANNVRIRVVYETTYTTLTGFSKPFDILESAGAFNPRKIGEDHNQTQSYKDLLYQEILNNNPKFFDSFLGEIVGNNKSLPDTLGIKINEKIENFTSNISDISVCNLKSLTSMLKELRIDFEEYNQQFPPSLSRLVDIFSVGASKQIGGKNQFTFNFDDNGFTNKTVYGKNLGNELFLENAILQTGENSENIVAYEKFSENYSLVNTNLLSATNVTYISSNAFSLSSYNSTWGWGLVIPNDVTGLTLGEYYRFFNYIPVTEDSNLNKFIDFDNSLNTYLIDLSAYNDYAGDDGIIEKILNHNLYTNLGLLSS